MFRTSLLLLLLTGFTTQAATAQLLGRDVTLPPELRLRPAGEIELQYSDLFDINRCILKQGTVSGLLVHLPPQLEGRIYYGSWELEANPPRPRLRRGTRLQDGAAELNLASLTHYPNDIADFGGRQEGDLFLQFEIWDETAAEVVILHRTVHFRVQNGLFQRTVTLVAPPFYSCVVEAGLPLPVISFAADRPVDARVLVAGVEPFVSQQGQRRHEVKLPGLPPQTTYVYRVELNAPDETILSREYTFTTPPLPGAGEPFRAILMSDSRAGVGAGTHAVEGVNHAVLSQLAANAWRLDPDLLLFPGDLINGWCDQPDAFRRQLRSFKSALSFLSPTVPIFTGIGNHETLLNIYDDGSRWGVALDRTPYSTQSAEAVFADEFANPTNGPAPETGNAPPYRETVYTLPWGQVLFIMLNSNYWFSTHPEQYGGNVEGAILDGQLEWLQQAVTQAEADPAIRWIVYATHEPTFPNGGHLHDAMWYHGGAPADNRGKDRSEVIERRDRWWSIIAGSSKSLLVVNGDEHNYSRTLIDAATPVYSDGSNNAAFKYPVWQIISGGAGAPYYTQAETPWSDQVVSFSTQQHFISLVFTPDRVSLEVMAVSGQVIDQDELNRIR